MDKNEHSVFTTQLGDGSFIAASFESPRFCVGGATQAEALSKAERALAFFFASKKEVQAKQSAAKSPKTTKVLQPVFAEERICA